MSTILFANERGGGFGHTNRLLAVATQLREHRAVFVVKDADLARPAIAAALGAAIEIGSFQATVSPHGTVWQKTHTLADILHDLGFADRKRLTTEVAAWGTVIDACRPDLVVGDFSPALRIAVAGRVPSVVVGNGFTIPPLTRPLPGVKRSRRLASKTCIRREAAILANVNAVRDEIGLPPFDCVAALFQGDETFVAAYPFLDPYQEVRTGPTIQPFNLPKLAAGLPVQQRTGPYVFCYLDADYEGINPLLTALNGVAVPSQVFVRNLDPREVARHCAPQVGIYQGQADFSFVLPQTRLLVHHGGAATIVAGLLAGVPQLLLPRHLEQELNAEGAATLETSVGLRISASADAVTVRDLIVRLLGHGAMQATAARVAGHLEGLRSLDPAWSVVSACRALLTGKQN